MTNKKKLEKKIAREQQEAAMRTFLEERGWICTGPWKDTWKRKSWKPRYDEWSFATLHQAYKIELKRSYEERIGL